MEANNLDFVKIMWHSICVAQIETRVLSRSYLIAVNSLKIFSFHFILARLMLLQDIFMAIYIYVYMHKNAEYS